MAAEEHAPSSGEYIHHHLTHLSNIETASPVDFHVVHWDSVFFSSLLGLVYVGRMLEMIFFRAPVVATGHAKEARFGVLAPLWILAAASIRFGFDSSLPLGLATAAAKTLGLRP